MKPKDSLNVSTPKGAKKKRGPKKKAKKDPNEPQKPISAYALFFRDTQAAIKGQNPNASFGEVSKIVASMWDSLELENKNGYKERADASKKEYLKTLAAYRATLTEDKPDGDQSDSNHFDETPAETDSLSPKNVSTSPITVSPEVINSPTPTKITTETTEVETIQLNDSDPHEEETVIEQKSPEHVMTICSSPEEQETTVEKNKPSICNGDLEEVVPICLRSGCNNPAIDSPEWDKEYCSSECVVEHCSTVFMAHVAARQKNAELIQA